MIARSMMFGALVLAMSWVLDAGAARAEESDAKKIVHKARQRADEALDTAEQKTEQAVDKVKEAKRKVVEVAAETKQAAERAADQAATKVGEIKTEAEAAAAKAKTEAEAAAHEAEGAIHMMRSRTHEIMRDAVGPTGENARRNATRRSAWRELAKNVDRPEQLPPNVREELRRHAQRIARLRRIRTLASDSKQTALVERTDALIAREEARHKRKLDTFWAARGKQARERPTPDDDQDPPDETPEEEEEQQP